MTENEKMALVNNEINNIAAEEINEDNMSETNEELLDNEFIEVPKEPFFKIKVGFLLSGIIIFIFAAGGFTLGFLWARKKIKKMKS